MVGVDRLGQKVRGAFTNRAYGILDRAKRGHHDDVGFGSGLQGRGEHIKAASRRQLQIGENHAECGAGERALRLVRIGASFDGEAVGMQRFGQGVSKRVLVFDEEDVDQSLKASG